MAQSDAKINTDDQTRSKLKAQGFRWSPTIGAWQAYRNHWSMELAKSLSA